MKILVTGSQGTVGSVLVPYLGEKGHEVFCCDQVRLYREGYSVVNILSSDELYRLFMRFKPDIVFHLAAMVSRVACEASPNLTVNTNISGLNNVIQLCKLFRAKLIFLSTSEVYGNIAGLLSENRDCSPNNLYGLSKYLGEKLIEYEATNGLDAVIVRPFMFYHEGEKSGDDHSAVIRFVDSLIRRHKITVYINSNRSWMHLDDGVKILEKLIYSREFSIINIGTNEMISAKKLAELICGKIGVEYDDYVIECPLPARMTLTKMPFLSRQSDLMGNIKFISIDEGLDRVIKSRS